jgi:Domain of unknown function (DUF4062)
MEDYVATDERPVEKCLNDVDQSDIYIGIFAFRYGYVPPSDHGNPDGLSANSKTLTESLKSTRDKFPSRVGVDETGIFPFAEHLP